MTREELLQNAKPILFNTEMVRAILDGRKTVTRRVVKYKYSNTEMSMHTDKYGTRLIEIQKDIEGETYGKNPDGGTWHKLLPYIEKEPPCKRGDILYVRETWNICNMDIEENAITFVYRVDKSEEQSARTVKVSDELWDKWEHTMSESNPEWRPSIHMPKEAARIFLRVKDVRVERLQECGKGWCLEIEKEGVVTPQDPILYVNDDKYHDALREEFQKLWDSTINKSDLALYGWDADPYVWVIEFERIKPDTEV